MRGPDAADILVYGCAAALAAGDVVLHRRGRRLVTHSLRQPVPAVVLCLLALHVVDVLGPLDPFRAFGRLIPQRTHA